MESHIMKFFAVLPALFAACASEASLPIAAPYLSTAGLYNRAITGSYGAYAAPYASYVDARFAYGAPVTAFNAGPLTAGPVAAAAPVATATYAAAPVVAAHPATYAAAYAAAPAPITVAAPISAGPVSSQFQAQDEFGNVAYGYQNINSAKQERGNALGGVTGSYTYADEAGVHTVNYVADEFGFRVAGDNLPVAPVYNGVAPLPVSDTLEVAAAKASFFEAFNAATKVKR